MKKNLALKILIGTVICYALAGFFGRLSGEEQMRRFVEASVNSFSDDPGFAGAYGEQIIEQPGLHGIKMNNLDHDVVIEKSKDGKIHVFYYHDPASSEALAQFEGETVSFDFEKMKVPKPKFKVNFTGGGHGVSVDNQVLRLEIPEAIRAVWVKSVSGHVTLQDVELDSARIETVSGDTLMKNVRAASVKHVSVSGNLRQDGLVENLETKTMSGDVALAPGSSHPEIRVQTVSGNTEVLFPDAAPDIHLSFKTTSGDLTLDRSFSDTRVDGSVKDLKIGQGLSRVEIDTISGDAQLSRARD